MELILTLALPPPRAAEVARRIEASPLYPVSIHRYTDMAAPPQEAQDLPVPFSAPSYCPSLRSNAAPKGYNELCWIWGHGDTSTWYQRLISSTPQGEIISVAYILSWSHRNDFLTSGASKGCPVFIRRRGLLSHCHSKGLCVCDPYTCSVPT